jgi:hypothetical protein
MYNPDRVVTAASLGLSFTIGSLIVFEPGLEELPPRGMQDLQVVVSRWGFYKPFHLL